MSQMIARSYIAGHWSQGDADGETFNPSTGEIASRFVSGSGADVDAAVDAARNAFERGGWSNNPRRRAGVLLAMADAVENAREAIVAIAVAEAGKRTGEMQHEVTAAVSELRYYAGIARTIFGRVQEVGEGQFSTFAREPIGVAAIIVPWNAPVTLLVRSLAPALAAGCTVVIKPAAQTSLTHHLMMAALTSVVDLPAGVVNSVNERGSEVGRALVAHTEVDAISFTGARDTAGLIMEAAAGTLKRLNLELGGKAPALLFDDADLDRAIPEVVRGAVAAAGQMCTAVTRILASENRYQETVERFAQAFAAVVVRPADDPESQMGPVISRRDRDRLAHTVDTCDAEVIVPGGLPDGVPENGHFLRPALLMVRDLASPLVQEELFGPVITIERFTTEEEAVHRANATVWGLAASVWSRDSARAHRVARSLKSGTVWINSHNRLFAEAETGGYRQSGLGRLHGLQGLDVFLETKHIFEETGFVPATLLA